MALIISLLSVKGGVGKTSAAVNLAAQAAVGGLRTLVVDLDPQGGATYTLGVDERAESGARAIATEDYAIKKAVVSTPWLGIDVIPADFSLRHLDLDLAARGKPRRRLSQILQPVAKRYDVIFVDCAPGITLANESAVRASRIVLVPVVPATLPMRAFEQLCAYVGADRRLRDLSTLGFLSMVDRRKRVHRELVVRLPIQHPAMLTTAIPSAVAIENMPLRRSPLLPTTRVGAPAIAYRDLWNEMQARVFPKRAPMGSRLERDDVVDLTIDADQESPANQRR